MKREINCRECVRQWMGIPDYDGEHKKYVPGKSIRDMRCDGCNCEIARGTECVAFSLYTDRHPYFAWEHEYVTTVECCHACGEEITAQKVTCPECCEPWHLECAEDDFPKLSPCCRVFWAYAE